MVKLLEKEFKKAQMDMISVYESYSLDGDTSIVPFLSKLRNELSRTISQLEKFNKSTVELVTKETK